jgi:hypothetical protein
MLKEGMRSLNAAEARQIAERVENALNGLSAHAMVRVIVQCGAMKILEERGMLEGFIANGALHAKLEGLPDSERLYQVALARAMGGDAAARRDVWSYEASRGSDEPFKENLTINITPFEVPDKLRVVITNGNASDANDIRTSLVSST